MLAAGRCYSDIFHSLAMRPSLQLAAVVALAATFVVLSSLVGSPFAALSVLSDSLSLHLARQVRQVA